MFCSSLTFDLSSSVFQQNQLTRKIGNYWQLKFQIKKKNVTDRLIKMLLHDCYIIYLKKRYSKNVTSF